ncbi:MAG: GNAT family N-acetyltransferase [Oscillospiraceae bacterium]|nr:GNAT family N-acetyltransferase [Oscillospiraceae bacterium]
MEPRPFGPIAYQTAYQPLLLSFLETCLPESHRSLDITGRHRYYLHVEAHFKAFWCMFDETRMIGTVAVSELSHDTCELKSLYLLECYHGMGYGKKLILHAMTYAKAHGYQKMYLDSLSTSEKALALYRKLGFHDTARYNTNPCSDVFMVKEL